MYHKICENLEKNGYVKTAVVLEGPCRGQRCFFTEDGQPAAAEPESAFAWEDCRKVFLQAEETGVIQAGGCPVLVEHYTRNPKLVILGGGHVSKPVAHLGAMLGFSVTVMDDRAEFLSRERFPEAEERILAGFEELSAKIPEYPNSYYVVVTRGHAGDTLCARQILKRPYRYFGMIGSRTKVKLTRQKLMEEGYAREALDSIYAPIGLDIGGETPEEIAVSIMAQIVQVRNQNRESCMDESICKAMRQGQHGVMMTIIKKEGSSPRGIGSKLFVNEEGRIYGSIGGGSVEYEALRFAAAVTDSCVRSYDLSPGDTRNLGMICGGRVEVFFERI